MSENNPALNIIKEDQTLWNTNRHPAGCPHCQRVFLVQTSLKETDCPLCRQAKLENQPARMRPTEPEQVIPFRIDKQNIYALYEKFVAEVWIKPEDFQPDLLLKRTTLLFWPMWLVDSDISGQWQMEAGFNYQVESSKEYYSGGQWHSQKQVEDRIRWEPRLGEVHTRIENVAVPALEEHQNRSQLTGQYQLKQAKSFNPDLLSNAILEVPDLPPDFAWSMAKPQMDKNAAQLCANAAGAQHQRNFAIKAEYTNLNWTELYLPMFATYYTDDDGQPQIIVVNGETGQINGPQVASQKRGLRIAGIIAGAAGVVLMLTLICLMITLIFPPAGAIAALLGILGFGLGIAAIIPAVWPGQWNRKQDGPRIISKGGPTWK